MRKTIVVVCAAVAITSGCSKDSPTGVTPPQPVDVYTPGLIFSPFTTTILRGGVVRFNMFGEEHNAIFDPEVPGRPADINIVRDVVISRTFNTRGTFPYDCTVHPGMSGEIVVQ